MIVLSLYAILIRADKTKVGGSSSKRECELMSESKASSRLTFPRTERALLLKRLHYYAYYPSLEWIDSGVTSQLFSPPSFGKEE
jgi:hypothetical protein